MEFPDPNLSLRHTRTPAPRIRRDGQPRLDAPALRRRGPDPARTNRGGVLTPTGGATVSTRTRGGTSPSSPAAALTSEPPAAAPSSTSATVMASSMLRRPFRGKRIPCRHGYIPVPTSSDSSSPDVEAAHKATSVRICLQGCKDPFGFEDLALKKTGENKRGMLSEVTAAPC